MGFFSLEVAVSAGWIGKVPKGDGGVRIAPFRGLSQTFVGAGLAELNAGKGRETDLGSKKFDLHVCVIRKKIR